MMTLAETAPVAAGRLPLADLRDHLRLPSGFADDTSLEPALERSLRAALAAIESRTAKALLRRGFLWGFDRWSGSGTETFPLAPVDTLDGVTIRDAAGAGTDTSASFRLVRDAHAPALVPQALAPPAIPQGGRVEVAFTGGYAEDWHGLPPDLREAVLIVAGRFFDGAGEGGALPAVVAGLIARHRRVGLRGVGA